MEKTICDTIEMLLTSVQDDVDDPALEFKLRTARQLNIACEEQFRTYHETLENADLEDETEEMLRELGYL